MFGLRSCSSDDWAVFISFLDASLGGAQLNAGSEIAVELEEHEVSS